jgi:hypothetical protein
MHCEEIFPTGKYALPTAWETFPMNIYSFPAYQENVLIRKYSFPDMQENAPTTQFFVSCISGKRSDEKIYIAHNTGNLPDSKKCISSCCDEVLSGCNSNCRARHCEPAG